MISIIVAMDKNRGIGKDNNLLTYLPGDLPRFKKITSGHHVIMGRKTFESLPNGPLKNRENIVITRSKKMKYPGVIFVNSFEEAIKLCPMESESFVIGGGEIYNLALKSANKLYITHIDQVFDADTFFPELDNSWVEESCENITEFSEIKFSYKVYKKY